MKENCMIQFSYMKGKKPLVVANWKLNPVGLMEAKSIYTEIKKGVSKLTEVEVVVAPPFLFIPTLAATLKSEGIQLAAQDLFWEEKGAFTGEISGSQLTALGVKYVIIGHSERRALGETDEEVNKKVKAALKNKLTPIVCVGEKDRDEQGAFFGFVEAEIKALAKDLSPKDIAKVVIAYEPIWAIGTGKTATVEDVKEMQIFITSVLAKIYERKVAEKVYLLYGGSVKPGNSKLLSEQGGMNGFLVGGASLVPKDFVEIVRAAIVGK